MENNLVDKRKEYNQKYIEKHKTDPKIICEKCYGSYTVFNKSHHTSSQKHKNALEIIKQKSQINL
jgi:hypothetical protein